MAHAAQASPVEHTSMEMDTSPADAAALLDGDAAAAAALANLGAAAGAAAAETGQSTGDGTFVQA